MWRHHSSGAVHTDSGPPDADGGYLASASDLMIGLLFVFIILVVVLALEQRRTDDLIKGLGDPRGTVTQVIGDGIRKALPLVIIDRESGVISLPEDVLFDLGSAKLTARGQSTLALAGQQLAEVLPCYVANQRQQRPCDANPQAHEIETIFIEGHTDDRPLLKPGYDNTNLSLDRARAVEQAMVQGSALIRFRNKADQPLFSFSAYADTRPRKGLAPSDAKNRRVDLRVVMTYRPPSTER